MGKDFLGKEGHEGVQELQGLLQHVQQHALGLLPALAVEAHLSQLDIPIAVVAPEEIVELLSGQAKLIFVEQVGNLLNQAVELAEDVLILSLIHI